MGVEIIAVLAFLAVVVERLTEYVFGTLFDKTPALNPHKWALMYIALAVGVLLTYTFHLDMLSLVGLEESTIGVILTGVAVGGGSNLLHEVLAGAKK